MNYNKNLSILKTIGLFDKKNIINYLFRIHKKYLAAKPFPNIQFKNFYL